MTVRAKISSSRSVRRPHHRRLSAVAAAVCLSTVVATTQGAAWTEIHPPAAPPEVVHVSHEAVDLAGSGQALVDRYRELRPTLNHHAALAHWAAQFTPIPGNVRFHAWTLYNHFVDPMTDSLVQNFAAVIDGATPVDRALATIADDAVKAFGDFLAAELSGHSNVVPPSGDSAGGADPWAYWVIEVAAAPLYYLPVPPAVIVQVPILARLAVDVAGTTATQLGAVVDGSSTPQQAWSAIGNYVRDEAMPRLIRTEQALFTPPPPPTGISTSDQPPETAPSKSADHRQRLQEMDTLVDDPGTAASTASVADRARSRSVVSGTGERLGERAPRAMKRLTRHNPPRHALAVADAPAEAVDTAESGDDDD